MLLVLPGPRSDASHAVHRDVGDVSGWRVIHRPEADLRTEVAVSELLKQLGGSSLRPETPVGACEPMCPSGRHHLFLR